MEEVSGAEVEESDTRRVERDVEASEDVTYDGRLIGVVISSIDDAQSFGVTLLCCADGSPEDALTASACIAGEKGKRGLE